LYLRLLKHTQSIMISVNVFSEDRAWSKKIKKKKEFFNLICKHFPKKYRFINKKISLTLLLSNNKNIKKLNKKFRNKDKPTDILSFSSNKEIRIKKDCYLGDMIISFNFMNKPKKLEGKIFREKVIKIFIHGFLHLLGFNHVILKDFKKMLKEEEKIYQSVISKVN
jgi:probable rRNA maturation factor